MGAPDERGDHEAGDLEDDVHDERPQGANRRPRASAQNVDDGGGESRRRERRDADDGERSVERERDRAPDER